MTRLTKMLKIKDRGYFKFWIDRSAVGVWQTYTNVYISELHLVYWLSYVRLGHKLMLFCIPGHTFNMSLTYSFIITFFISYILVIHSSENLPLSPLSPILFLSSTRRNVWKEMIQNYIRRQNFLSQTLQINALTEFRGGRPRLIKLQ
jgi:hypothetical protein